MRIRRVYIKKVGGEIASEACYTAWQGFSHLGYPLDFFEWEDLSENCLRLDPLTLVVGGTKVVHLALRQIGVEPPSPLNVPQELLGFAGRSIREASLGTVRGDIRSGSWQPTFVKPLVQTKSFTGFVLLSEADLAQLEHLSDDFMVQAADPIEFVSEWRYFVHRREVVGLARYRGNWALCPSSQTVRDAVSSYLQCPIACSLDFGITREGQTLLIEANDAIALGAYGLDAVTYARMLEDRWLEIVGAV